MGLGVYEIQNVVLVVMVKLIIAACTLHNLCMGEDFISEEHPDGCPRDNDDNDMWIMQQGKTVFIWIMNVCFYQYSDFLAILEHSVTVNERTWYFVSM